jgi:hypothetical protein
MHEAGYAPVPKAIINSFPGTLVIPVTRFCTIVIQPERMHSALSTTRGSCKR